MTKQGSGPVRGIGIPPLMSLPYGVYAMPTMKPNMNRPSFAARNALKAEVEKRRIERVNADLARFELREAATVAARILFDQHQKEIFELAASLVREGKLDEIVRREKEIRGLGGSISVEF